MNTISTYISLHLPLDLSLHLPILILLFGWILDLILGDPQCLPHPVVYMGKWISFCEHRFNRGRHRMVNGAIIATVSILLVYFLTIILCHTLPQCLGSFISRILPHHLASPLPADDVSFSSFLTIIISSVLLFFCLAGHTLRREVSMVFQALEVSLDAGRRQVSRIVGRDTQELSAQEVRTAALETLAENLSDGVIAPRFWYAVLGVPCMMSYKIVNTLDSMIGYRTPRYKSFGCWAARIDDMANFIPARLTSLLILLSATILQLNFRSLPSRLSFLRRYASQHASPNSGWPEAALASVLQCQFGGTHHYFGTSFYKPYIGDTARPLTTADLHLSLRICMVAEIMAVVTQMLHI